MKNNGFNRRSFVKKSAAAAALGTSLASSAAAEGPTGARNIGIESAVERLLRQHDFRRARALLEKHDVKYDGNVVRLPEVQSADDGGSTQDGVSTQDEWNKSQSSFSHFAWLSSGDIYHSQMTWVLEGAGSAETSGPVDGIGATVNPDLWEPVLDSWNFSDRCSLHERGAKGVIGEFNDPDGPLTVSPDDRDGWMTVDFEKTEPGEHNIYGTYTHTWNPFGIPGWASFSLAVGPIGVSVSGEVDTWTKRSDDNL